MRSFDESHDFNLSRPSTFPEIHQLENYYQTDTRYTSKIRREIKSTQSQVVTTPSVLRSDNKTHLITDSRTLIKVEDHSYIQ
jgi:hypothetical protein